MMTPERRRHTPDEERLRSWLREQARPMPAEALDRALLTTRSTSQLRQRVWRDWPSRRLILAFGSVAAAVVILVAIAPLGRLVRPAFPYGPGAGTATGFEGTWSSTDCAQWWTDGGATDCARWGDGSTLRLTIGSGERPAATYDDASCLASGAAPTAFTALGTGMYERPFLWIVFDRRGCDSFGAAGDGRLQLYRDPGSDTLWEDEDGDGWGLIWHRVR